MVGQFNAHPVVSLFVLVEPTNTFSDDASGASESMFTVRVTNVSRATVHRVAVVPFCDGASIGQPTEIQLDDVSVDSGLRRNTYTTGRLERTAGWDQCAGDVVFEVAASSSELTEDEVFGQPDGHCGGLPARGVLAFATGHLQTVGTGCIVGRVYGEIRHLGRTTSRLHAEFVEGQFGFEVVDLGSSNGIGSSQLEGGLGGVLLSSEGIFWIGDIAARFFPGTALPSDLRAWALPTKR